MSDDELLAGFEDGSLPHAEWTHRAHVRVAFGYLCRFDLEEAIERMREGIRRYNAVHGVEDGPTAGYHETMTQAFLRLIHQAMQVRGPFGDASAFCEGNQELLQKRVLLCYYSRELMNSPQARSVFVPPDLAPLDRLGLKSLPPQEILDDPGAGEAAESSDVV